MSAGQELTAHFVDECTDQGRPEMVRALKGQVAQRAKILLKDGCTVDEVKAAITEFVRRRGTTALALGEIVLELARNQDPDPTLRPANRKLAMQWVEEHGWPTGAMFVRGSHAGHYKYDPLGVDRVTEQDWPYSKPSFDEIVRALA